MTRKDIAKTISQFSGLTNQNAAEIVDRVVQAIADTIVREQRLELRNFGVFEVRQRRSRPYRNPNTQETVIAPERYVVVFKPGKELESRVQAAVEQRLNWQKIAADSLHDEQDRPRKRPSNRPGDSDRA